MYLRPVLPLFHEKLHLLIRDQTVRLKYEIRQKYQEPSKEAQGNLS